MSKSCNIAGRSHFFTRMESFNITILTAIRSTVRINSPRSSQNHDYPRGKVMVLS